VPAAPPAVVRARARVRGASLIEASVALVIFAVGLLGVAALYAQSRIADRAADMRARAVLLAADLAERVRANRPGAAGYDDARSGAGSLGLTCQSGSACGPVQMARFDKAQWLDAVRESLPAGAATVRAMSAPADGYAIALTWTDVAAGADSYTLRMQP
jgi:type IV pilus assembly protein PilV